MSPKADLRIGFEESSIELPLDVLVPLKTLTPSVLKSKKYQQILASVQKVGIIEPPVVARDRKHRGKFFILDGLLRIEVLKALGHQSVECLVSTDDEAFTYNKRISRLTVVQEHRMITRAVERGVAVERIAEALGLEAGTVRMRFRMLDGVCNEVAASLADKPCPMAVFRLLKRMTPLRQMESAELMIGQGNYSSSFAKALLAATDESQRNDVDARKKPPDVSREQIARLERELVGLQSQMKYVEDSYGTDNLHLTIAKTYLTSLLGRPRVVEWMRRRHADFLAEFQSIAELGVSTTTAQYAHA